MNELFRFAGQDPAIPDNVSTKWLYELARDTWSMWLPVETYPSILSGAFYAVQAHDDLWVIGINNNFCYNYNLSVLHYCSKRNADILLLAGVCTTITIRETN